MCANFFVQGQEFDIPSMNNLKGQVRKLKDALARTQKAHRLTLQKLRRACEEKRLLSEQVQLMEKKVTTECKLLAEGFCLPFLRVATFKLPRKSYTYNAVSEGTPRKILGGFLIHTWA